MNVIVLAALVPTLLLAGISWWVQPAAGAPSGTRPRAAVMLAPSVAVAALIVAAIALPHGPPGLFEWGALLCAVVAAVGGGPLTAQVLAWARDSARRDGPGKPGSLDANGLDRAASTLRGGAWIGVLERLGVAVSLLTGHPEGIAFVLAVKGLGRYPELQADAGTSERFIIGTFTSVLWAVGACGVALLGR